MRKIYFLLSCLISFATFSQDLIITGVFDGPLSGGTPKVIELYAVNDISDLSLYGIGSANNGGGTDGEEFTFSGAATSGQFLYLTANDVEFTTYFGLTADFVDSTANVNGDDAIELFFNSNVIDVFGDINVDGSGESWEYQDGWVYRKDNTGPDGNTFTEANWTISGSNVVDGCSDNASCSSVFPIGTFTFGGTPIPSLSLSGAEPSGSTTTIPPNELDQTELEFLIGNFTIGEPGTATQADGYVSWEILNLTDGGTHQSGDLFDLTTQPISVTTFEAGKTYQLNAVLKDNSDVDLTNPEASYTLTSEALGYTDVADITALKADVSADGLGKYYNITGAVTFTHGDGFRNRKWFQDATPSGIFVEDEDEVIADGAYAVGDQVSGLKGFTRDVNGVLTFEPSEDSGSKTGSTSVSPLVLSISEFNTNFETYESLLVGFENVTFTDGDGTTTFDTGNNYEFGNGTDVSEARTTFFGADYIGSVIPDAQIAGLVGLAAEFNGSTQIYPRSLTDIDATLGLSDIALNNFSLYPNPVNNGSFNIKSQNTENFNIEVYNVFGKRVLELKQIQDQNINVRQLQSGVYLVRITQNDASTTKKLIIK